MIVTVNTLAQPVGGEVRRFTIEVAGVRVGTMTATRQPQPDGQIRYTLVSDVRVNFLVYKLVIYYQVENLFRNGQLVLSTVDARTNRGNYQSRTEWKGDHYEIVADQYKYKRRATETARIGYTITNLYFDEPVGRNRVYAEYFGDYFTLLPEKANSYRARLSDREDEYQYQRGRLTKIVKKNALKNFIIRPVD